MDAVRVSEDRRGLEADQFLDRGAPPKEQPRIFEEYPLAQPAWHGSGCLRHPIRLQRRTFEFTRSRRLASPAVASRVQGRVRRRPERAEEWPETREMRWRGREVFAPVWRIGRWLQHPERQPSSCRRP